MAAPECDDCGQVEGSRVHRDTQLHHFHLFSVPLMDRPAADFPEGWPPGVHVSCARSKTSDHDIELIRRQSWKWVAEHKMRADVGDAPLAD